MDRKLGGLAQLLIFMVIFVLAPMNAGAQSRSERRYQEWVASLPAEGDAPSPEYVESAARAMIGSMLKDPYSAVYQVGKIERGTWRGMFEKHGTPGWIAYVSVNAKNSYGAYVGAKEYRMVFRSGVVVENYMFDRYGWFPMIGMKGAPFTPPPLTDPSPIQ